jgi:hypothetical protein
MAYVCTLLNQSVGLVCFDAKCNLKNVIFIVWCLIRSKIVVKLKIFSVYQKNLFKFFVKWFLFFKTLSHISSLRSPEIVGVCRKLLNFYRSSLEPTTSH